MGGLGLLVTFSAFLGIFLASALLSHKRGDQFANNLLATLLIMLSLYMFRHVIYPFGNKTAYQGVELVGNLMGFSFGPVFYFYARRVLGTGISWKEFRMHFLPNAILIFLIVAAVVIDHIEGVVHVSMKPITFSRFLGLIGLAQLLHISAYIVATVHLLYRSKLVDRVRQIQAGHQWIRNMTIGFSMLLSVSLFLTFKFLFGEQIIMLSKPEEAIALSSCVMINYLGYKMIHRPEILSSLGFCIIHKHKEVFLSPSSRSHYEMNISQYMRNEKPFLNSDLRMHQLANDLRMKPHDLSQVINQCYGKNFSEFVNYYRIEEAKRLMEHADWSKETIQGIFLEVGFNSKSAFNRAFRRNCGCTPSQYLSSKDILS